jgi:RNA polymerase sigma-70 factor (ECF subfamily)
MLMNRKCKTVLLQGIRKETEHEVNEAIGTTIVQTNVFGADVWGNKSEVGTRQKSKTSVKTLHMEADSTITDEQLMLACQKGREEALEQIYQRHYRSILMFILRLVQDRDLAEDLTQETFFRVFNNRHTWEPRSKFTSWLYRIARNLCIDEKRRYWNRLVHMDSQFNDQSQNPQSSFLDNVEDQNGDARNAFSAKIDEQTIKHAINQLSEEQREVIILNKYQGLSYIEIADILGATPESIKQRAYRAHLKLRQILKPLLQEYA